jgi:hypothetical protein
MILSSLFGFAFVVFLGTDKEGSFGRKDKRKVE